jgi:hypothetical protein
MWNALVGVAAGFVAMFGGSTTSTTTHNPHDYNDYRPHATTTVAQSVNIQCIAAAVAAREASLGSAQSANMSAVNSAYATRASALAAAYSQITPDSIKKGIRAAWNSFNAAVKMANKTWRTAEQAAWKQFKTALRACGNGATSYADQMGEGESGGWNND